MKFNFGLIDIRYLWSEAACPDHRGHPRRRRDYPLSVICGAKRHPRRRRDYLLFVNKYLLSIKHNITMTDEPLTMNY